MNSKESKEIEKASDGPQLWHLALYAGSLSSSEHLQKRVSVCTSIAMLSNHHFNLWPLRSHRDLVIMKISFYYYRFEASYSWSHSHASAQLIPSYYVTYTTIGCVCVLCYPPISSIVCLYLTTLYRI